MRSKLKMPSDDLAGALFKRACRYLNSRRSRRMNILSPSILTADFWRLGEVVTKIKENGGSMLHFDVMDGMFVPSLSFGLPVLSSIAKETDLFLDVHLMIEEPIRYLNAFADAGADGITVHVEACQDMPQTLEKIRALGKKVGITLNPDTPISAVEPYLEMVDMILVMSVNPGFGGQKLIPSCLDKIRELKGILDSRGLQKDIEIDGGINRDNIYEVLDAGANVIVAGSAVVGAQIEDNMRYFLNAIDKK